MPQLLVPVSEAREDSWGKLPDIFGPAYPHLHPTSRRNRKPLRVT